MRAKASGTSTPDSGLSVSRRLVLAGALGPLLVRCSSDSNSDTAGLTQLLGRSLHVFSGADSVALKDVAGTPFASLGVRVGSGAQTMLVLATRSGESTVWTSSSHIALELQAGRILRTAGLTENLSGTTFSGSDPLGMGIRNLREPATLKRSLDFSDRNAYGVLVESTVTLNGPADVEILGTHIACVHATEQCTCKELGWNFTNEFWASAQTGLVWRSVQNIHPDFAPLEIEILRPPKS
ncbi:MAG TPA: YjbF family lipoprotein [Rhizomicrobium sp.]|jgi:hypothetical protein